MQFKIFAVVLHEWKVIIWVSQRLILVRDLSIERTQQCLHLHGSPMTQALNCDIDSDSTVERGLRLHRSASSGLGHHPAGEPRQTQHLVWVRHIICPPLFSRPAERVWMALYSSTPPPPVPQTPALPTAGWPICLGCTQGGFSDTVVANYKFNLHFN